MRELIERLEKAEGPDAELDKCIMMAVDYKEYERRWWAARPDDIAARYMSKDQQKQMAEDNWIAPPYTASIDAALTLVPDGHASAVGTMAFKDSDKLPWATYWTPQGWPYSTEAATPALALCAAALRARAQMERGK